MHPAVDPSASEINAETALDIDLALDVLRRAGTRAVQAKGCQFHINDYYSPCNDIAFLESNGDLWREPHEPEGIDWHVEHQLGVALDVSRFVEELREIPAESPQPGVFRWNNRFWNGADALVQYGLVRSRRPARIVEIGCGWSSLLLAHALARNEAEGAPRTRVTQIEPHPRAELMAALPTYWARHETILQRTPLDLFDALGPGDILFYDGSHVAKTASDVNWFFFRVLPRLAPGVLIHLHDIFLPRDYPKDWLLKDGRTWNEQYVLQAFLMHNDAYRVEIANAYLWHKHPERLTELYRGIQPASGCSLWMVKHSR